MILTFTDASTKNQVAINPEHIVVVFVATDENGSKTVINVLNGNIAVDESYEDVLGQVRVALNAQ
jgi:hypothetical protein